MVARSYRVLAADIKSLLISALVSLDLKNLKLGQFEFQVVFVFNSIFASHKKVNNLDSYYVPNYERIVDKLEKHKKYK